MPDDDWKRPLWILEIKSRSSLNQFKKCAAQLVDNGHDVCRVLKGNPQYYVYEVVVETMEDCDSSPLKVMWVPDQLARATGWMIDEFERFEINNSLSMMPDDEPSAEVEDAYRQLCAEMEYDPYMMEHEEDSDDEMWEHEDNDPFDPPTDAFCKMMISDA